MRTETDLTKRKGQEGAEVLSLILHVWIRFHFPPNYCNCSQKSLGELSSMQMPEHGNLSVILVTQRLISIEMADMKRTYSSCRPFLTAAIRPDSWSLGHPKLLQTFTCRHYICLSQDIHTPNSRYENQMSQTSQKGMFLERFDFPCGGISIYALHTDFSLLIPTLCVNILLSACI